ncbi:MAG: stage III sporulation protein AC [Christensenellales bacterium]|nr:stage III sporulation protein AC [Clostridia bacterium]MDY4083734.1 stage III sporulation protein AC [Eubacteriales bacterium]
MEISVIFKIAGIGLITAVLNIILKKSDKDEIATFITIGGLIMVLLIVVDMIGGLFDNLKNILGVY